MYLALIFSDVFSKHSWSCRTVCRRRIKINVRDFIIQFYYLECNVARKYNVCCNGAILIYVLQERRAQNHMQRLRSVKQVEMALHTRPAPAQCSRCWGVCWWCCVSPHPGWASHRWSSSRSNPFPVPFSSHGSAPTGTFSSSPSTILGTWPPPEKNRHPFRNSGEVRMNESGGL